MPEYIDRLALLKEISSSRRMLQSAFPKRSFGFGDVMDYIYTAPAADVAEVRHGYWYRHDKKKHGDTCYYCSVCEKMALADCMVWELTDYCPFCGARMDGKGDEK